MSEPLSTLKDNDYDMAIIKNRLDGCHELLKVQASVLTDEYMKGMYNGMELILAVIEDREPVYVSKILRNSKQNLNNSQQK